MNRIIHGTKKNIFFVLLFIALVVLQSTIIHRLAVYGVKPDLMLISIVAFALLGGPREGALAGFWAGCIQDLLFAKVFGFNILAKTVTGYLMGFTQKRFFKDNILVLIFTLFLGNLLHDVLSLLLFNVLGANYSLTTSFEKLILPLSLYNTVLAPFIYYLVRKLRIIPLFEENEWN